MRFFFRVVSIEISKPARNNGSIVIHSVLVPSRASYLVENDMQDLIKLPDSTYIKSRLTKYAVPVSSTFNLLNEKGRTASSKPVTHLRSKYSVIMCTENTDIPHSAIPFEIMADFRVNRKREFLPLFQTNVLNMRIRDLIEITPDTRLLNFTYVYNPSSVGKLRFLKQIEMTLHQFLSLGFTEKDLDEVKGVFADTGLYLLCATLFIGSVHVSNCEFLLVKIIIICKVL